MTTFTAFFEEDYGTTGSDLQQLGAAKDNISSPMKSLAKLCSHGGSESLKPVIAQAKDTYKNAKQVVEETCKIAANILVAAVILKKGGSADDVKETMTVMTQHYEVPKEKLPAKLQKLLGDILKGTTTDEKQKTTRKKTSRALQDDGDENGPAKPKRGKQAQPSESSKPRRSPRAGDDEGKGKKVKGSH